MGVREMWLVDTDKKEIEVRSFEAGKRPSSSSATFYGPKFFPKSGSLKPAMEIHGSMPGAISLLF